MAEQRKCACPSDDAEDCNNARYGHYDDGTPVSDDLCECFCHWAPDDDDEPEEHQGQAKRGEGA